MYTAKDDRAKCRLMARAGAADYDALRAYCACRIKEALGKTSDHISKNSVRRLNRVYNQIRTLMCICTLFFHQFSVQRRFIAQIIILRG